MTERTPLDWTVPTSIWDRFVDHVTNKHGKFEGYASREAERAMREYIDADEFADIEDTIDRLVTAAGRSPKALEEKNSATVTDAAEETRRVQVYVDADLLDEFRHYVDTNADVRYGLAFGRALRDRYNGGRAARLGDKLDRVVDDAEKLLGELTEDSDDTLTKSERTTIAIANRLPDQFDADDLADAINAETSGTDYYHDRYASAVVEQKGLKRYERANKPDLFLTPETWRARVTGDVIEALGGDPIDDTVSGPFTPGELEQAMATAGIEVSEDNADVVTEFKDRLLNRLGFEYDDDTGAYTDSSTDLPSPASPETTSSTTGDSAIATDGGHTVDDDPGGDEDTDSPSGVKQYLNESDDTSATDDVDAMMDALEAGHPGSKCGGET